MTSGTASDAVEGAPHHVWATRYRHGAELNLEDSLRRVARALASVEAGQQAAWEERFLGIMQSRSFLPGGRIIAGAGTGRRVTLANCFVMGGIEDSVEGIFRALSEGALTMQQGGGVGYDFSTLRPKGAVAASTGRVASGPVSFMRIWDSMCEAMLSTGARRGAMMATLRCDHPDIEDFIAAKQEPGVLTNFNLSVLVSDDFMAAVRKGLGWPLVFAGHNGAMVEHRRVDATALWNALLKSAYESAEPGVLFIDRINRFNNLGYCETITATNPCGEVPLPPYGACVLGSLNLASFVRDGFAASARFDHARLDAAARVATRMLDNAVTLSHYPLPTQAEQAQATRRVGLGIMGLADALTLLGLRYDRPAAREAAAAAMRTICHAAYAQSAELAQEKGAFPRFQREAYLAAPFVSALPRAIRKSIGRSGIRNSHLTAIAPTGSISLAAGGVSSGLEPPLAPELRRSIRQQDGSSRDFVLLNHAVKRWRDAGGSGLPPAFCAAQEIVPEAHLAMQAALQPFVDSAISKTVAIPTNCPFDSFRSVFATAFDLGLKGCTVFRSNPARGEGPPISAAGCDSGGGISECAG